MRQGDPISIMFSCSIQLVADATAFFVKVVLYKEWIHSA